MRNTLKILGLHLLTIRCSFWQKEINIIETRLAALAIFFNSTY